MRREAEKAHAHESYERPAWFDLAHQKLDAAVDAAYGWPANLTDEQILEILLALNLELILELFTFAVDPPDRGA